MIEHEKSVVALLQRVEKEQDGPLVMAEVGVCHGTTSADLLRRFPNARRVDPVEYLYECPPGRVVRIPVSGCPIRGGGRIVWFMPLEKNEEGEVTTWVRVIRSADDGTWTGYVTLQVRFARVEASDWRIAAILRYAET